MRIFLVVSIMVLFGHYGIGNELDVFGKTLAVIWLVVGAIAAGLQDIREIFEVD